MRMNEPGTPDLEDLLRGAAHALRHRWVDILEPWDLSPHHARALRVICAHGQLRLSELADKLRVAPRSVTDVVDALEARGLAARTPDPEDRRATTVRPTDAGRSTLTEIEDARHADAGEHFKRLSEREQQLLAKLLTKLG